VQNFVPRAANGVLKYQHDYSAILRSYSARYRNALLLFYWQLCILLTSLINY